MFTTLIQVSKEVERMVCARDVSVAQIDIAIALLDKIGVELRLYQSTNPKKSVLAEPIDIDGIALITT